MADQTRQFGANSWVVEELYREYLADPSSVAESWHDFFSDYSPPGGSPAAPPATDGRSNGRTSATGDGQDASSAGRSTVVQERAAAPAADRGAPAGKPAEAPSVPEGSKPLRGVGAVIAENMETSLGVPTATSFRDVPAKLLEVNRRILNNQLARSRGGKVSFTHLIGWAVVQAVSRMPAMARSYHEDADGKPYVREPDDFNLGLAIDVERKDGSRTLLVPSIKRAQATDFAGFYRAYEDVVRKVRTGDLSPEMFADTTATLTNPGTVGTVGSVPRLMAGQSAIIGVGAIDYPAEFKATDPRTLADIGVGKVITITSTYDHRVIQGAESGMFLRLVEEMLLGEHAFYDEIFASLRIPYEPVRWHTDESSRIAGDPAAMAAKQIAVQKLANMYRVRGHLIANLNPLQHTFRKVHPELDPAHYGLTIWDLDREFYVDGFAGHARLRLGDLLGVLRDAYCRTVGIEYMHISDPDQKAWIQSEVEDKRPAIPPERQRHVLSRLNAAEAFERFLHTKYLGQKRFSLEGAESLIPMLDAVLSAAADEGLSEAVMGMAHRGRLNVLANILAKSYEKIFREFEGDIDPNSVQGSGDVKYHLGATGVHRSPSGAEIPVSLAANPSHLEAVDPVVVGMARAKADARGDSAKGGSVLPILVHGDAAFAGEGVVAETLGMSQLKGYQVGGTVHVIVNNQLGFTTAPHQGRSSEYATDVAKMVQAPIFHVNGDDPEACVRVMDMAFRFRQRFRKDVVVDVICYRRHGHNEGDEPAFTQPIMYAAIEGRRSVRKLYTEELVNRGDLTVEDAEKALDDFRSMLEGALQETRGSKPAQQTLPPAPQLRGVASRVETGVELDRLQRLAKQLTSWPQDFEPHPKLVRQLAKRRDMLEQDAVDWPMAELLAMGTLLEEGHPIRFAGQDSRRGTFNQRHSVLVDHRVGDEHIPLQHLGDGQGTFAVYDSPLNEFAAMGFEYGYSVARPDALTVWEAQFGDFHNTGQVIVDQFIVAAEDKWAQTSGLVLLLPHGYEGQGPEHSSARIERWLTLCAEDNIQVVQPTTAAQHFHVLRRQMGRDLRKPLVVIAPKSLLRARDVLSPASALTTGSFEEVLDDPRPPSDATAVRRAVVCTGKVAYDAMRARDERSAPVVVLRVEQLYPWPGTRLGELLGGYPNLRDVTWLQDEPSNMGAWPFASSRLRDVLAGLSETPALRAATRFESASPATGSHAVHELEQAALIEEAFAELDGGPAARDAG